MKKNTIIAILCLTAIACKKDPEKTLNDTVETQVTTPPKHPTNTTKSDTLTIDKRCAVNYWAPKEKMDKMEKDGGDGFYTASDDVGWYIYESTRYLDSINFPIIRTKGYRYIRFKKADGSSEYINTDTIHGIANIYFFDPHKTVINADITNIYESFPEYFTPSE